MKKLPLEIIIPIYNEGDKIIKLLDLFKTLVHTPFRVLFCYDLDSDNIFQYENSFKKFNFEIALIKNPSQGPCSAIKEGFNSGNSDCVVVYPADDFLNVNIIKRLIKKNVISYYLNY